MISIEKLRQGLTYDSETGKLTWLIGRRKGKIAGAITKKGYIRLKVDRNYMAHRVAWALHYGKWPDNSLDHIDGNRTNNRIGNLREAFPHQNAVNSKIRSDNKSGVRGVVQDQYGWIAHIQFDKKRHYLGYFKTKAEAIAARAEAEVKHFGEWRRKDYEYAST